jgi:arylsulfatase A-like enzyme
VTVNTGFYPTFMQGMGLGFRPEQHVDGRSILPAIQGQTQALDRTLFWAYPDKHGLGHQPSVAVRQGPHKLIYWLADSHSELYNVETDLAERSDLKRSHPEVAERLRSALHHNGRRCRKK